MTLKDYLANFSGRDVALATEEGDKFLCICNKEQIENEYKHFLNRKVVDSYIRQLDKATAVIVEGTEKGKYWTKKEFDTKEIEIDRVPFVCEKCNQYTGLIYVFFSKTKYRPLKEVSICQKCGAKINTESAVKTVLKNRNDFLMKEAVIRKGLSY